MNVLVINCGSSSLKYQLIDSLKEEVLAKGLCERIGIEGSQIVYQKAGGEKETTVAPMPTHTEAIGMVLDALQNEKTGVIKSLDEIGAVGHRMAERRPLMVDVLPLSLEEIFIYELGGEHYAVKEIVL